MKRCYHGVSWESGFGFALAGLSLGFDRRAEHVEGISPLLTKLGVAVPNYPVGLADRQLTVGPPALRYAVYDFEPRDKRRRGYPAALLCLVDPANAAGDARTLSNEELVRRYDLEFVSEPTQPNYDPSQDVVTAWGADGFAVHVRGQRNIFLLGQLHGAILAGDVAVVAPSMPGAGAGPVRLVLVSMMSAEEKAQMREADETSGALLRAVAETGILEQLARAGRRYLSVTPEWFDEAQDEVIFFLEPVDSSRVNRGWFSLAEMQAWAGADAGPVVRDDTLERFSSQPQFENWESRLFQGLARIGAVSRYGAQLVWMPKERKVPAVRYRATRETEHIFPSGIYPLQSLMVQHAIPLVQDQRISPQNRVTRTG